VTSAHGTDGSRLRPSGEAGFTLVELLIAAAITGILGAAVVSLILGQNRFYAKVDATVTAEQNIRAVGDLIGSELRMGRAGDLLAATEDSVSVRFDIYRAVVCDSVGAGQATLLVYDSVPNPSLASGFIGTAFVEAYDTTFAYQDGWTGSVTATGSGPRSTCSAAGAPDTAAIAMYRTISGWSGFPEGTPERGAIVRRYGQLTYRFGASVIGNGRAVFRGAQELAGPFSSTSGFRYVMSDGSVATSVSGASLLDVTAIRIVATAIDDDSRLDVTRALTLDIPLRN